MTSRSKGDNPLLSAALGYAERGWAVFPLYPRDKRPLTDNGFQDASTSRHDILQWWQVAPEANIGLATGNLFDVLDIDGPQAVPALQDILGTAYRHAGPVANTGKGKHLYFRAIEGARNRAGLLGGKLDYRGTGGYVVAPPSIHPSGRTYRWDDDRDDSRPLPVVPESLRDTILRPRSEPRDKLAVAMGSLRREDPRLLKLTVRGQYILGRPPILELADQMGLIIVREGTKYVTNCIFHPDPGPSMVLYTDDDTFHCYGCEAHGDSLDLKDRKDMTGRTAL